MFTFQLMKKNKTITVICGRFYGNDQPRYQGIAIKTGSLLAKYGYTVATGGGSGQMCDVNKAAVEGGAEVTSIQLSVNGENTCEYFTEKRVFDDISYRQKKLLDIADGIIMLPGGLGTLYELVDILERKHFGKFPANAPIILVDKNYYKTIEEFLRNASEVGFIEHKLEEMCVCVETPEEAIELLNIFFEEQN